MQGEIRREGEKKENSACLFSIKKKTLSPCRLFPREFEILLLMYFLLLQIIQMIVSKDNHCNNLGTGTAQPALSSCFLLPCMKPTTPNFMNYISHCCTSN